QNYESGVRLQETKGGGWAPPKGDIQPPRGCASHGGSKERIPGCKTGKCPSGGRSVHAGPDAGIATGRFACPSNKSAGWTTGGEFSLSAGPRRPVPHDGWRQINSML